MILIAFHLQLQTQYTHTLPHMFGHHSRIVFRQQVTQLLCDHTAPLYFYPTMLLRATSQSNFAPTRPRCAKFDMLDVIFHAITTCSSSLSLLLDKRTHPFTSTFYTRKRHLNKAYTHSYYVKGHKADYKRKVN